MPAPNNVPIGGSTTGFMPNSDGGNFQGAGAGQSVSFSLLGGNYLLAATSGVSVSVIMPDGITAIDVSNGGLPANGGAMLLHLPPGQYLLSVNVGTSAAGLLARVPHRGP